MPYFPGKAMWFFEYLHQGGETFVLEVVRQGQEIFSYVNCPPNNYFLGAKSFVPFAYLLDRYGLLAGCIPCVVR